MKRTAFKQFILSISAIISTMCAMVGLALFSMPELFIMVDLNISSLCVILMYSWNEHLLSKVCCCIPSMENLLELRRSNTEIVMHHLTNNAQREQAMPDNDICEIENDTDKYKEDADHIVPDRDNWSGQRQSNKSSDNTSI